MKSRTLLLAVLLPCATAASAAAGGRAPRRRASSARSADTSRPRSALRAIRGFDLASMALDHPFDDREAQSRSLYKYLEKVFNLHKRQISRLIQICSLLSNS